PPPPQIFFFFFSPPPPPPPGKGSSPPGRVLWWMHQSEVVTGAIQRAHWNNAGTGDTGATESVSIVTSQSFEEHFNGLFEKNHLRYSVETTGFASRLNPPSPAGSFCGTLHQCLSSFTWPPRVLPIRTMADEEAVTCAPHAAREKARERPRVVRFVHEDHSLDADHLDEEAAVDAHLAGIVPETDDPSTAVGTFRTYFLGTFFGVGLGFMNAMFSFKSNPVTISSTMVTIITYPLGHLMARVLLTRKFRTLGFEWTLNPGPFTLKEHVLITLI
ncbi:MAG: OPT oligopeptide transporter protein-domain-containing protein, partial [Olpidium bornovanus]